MADSLRIYWAGALFNHKELLGNLQLARALEEVSHGRFSVHLAQDDEAESTRDAVAIRNADLTALAHCDAIVANFDGAELDSGTVVEFCFAKALDLPAVLFRTDFRAGGDTAECPWNLMCAGWPRIETLCINAMASYHQFIRSAPTQEDAVVQWNRSLAVQLSESLEHAIAQPAWLAPDQAFEHYRRTIRSAGGNLDLLLTDEILHELIDRKIRLGLLG